MRYIYLDAGRIDKDWLEKANELTTAIKAEADEEKRRELINKNAAHWGKPEIKNALLQMSNKKCWYTEADDCVSDWHVDHFRPKSTYQWLAFDWTNYRISGGIPNRKKSNKFPLSDDAHCAKFDAQDLAPERPMLIDPARPNDADLVTYDEQGMVKSARPDDDAVRRRVELTCEYLDLNSERLIARRLTVWNTCQAKVEQIHKLVAGAVNVQAALMSETVKALALEVKQAIRPEAPFSAVTKANVRTNDVSWILEIPEM